MIEIKKAETKDFETMAILISSDIAWSRYGIDLDNALNLIKSAEDEFYVARDNQDVIGFCALRLNGVGNIGAYLRMIVVSKAHRNSGIGKMLIDYVWNLVKENIPNLFLICSTDNIRAQNFYKREGFKQVGILDGLVVPGHDEILYWKTVGSLR